MWSPDDPSNRMPMVWSDLEPYEGEGVRFRADVFEAFQHLIAMRHSLLALQMGGFEVLDADDERGIFVFARRYGDQQVVVALNRSEQVHDVEISVGTQPVADAADPKQTHRLEAASDSERATLRWSDAVLPLEPNEDGMVDVELPPYGFVVLTPVTTLRTQP